MPSTLPALLALAASCGAAHAADCSAQSPATRTPVLELYTSEGCSSCPPADRWLSGLKDAAAQGRVLRPLPASAGHAQQVNLVVTEVKTGKPLQALSLACS